MKKYLLKNNLFFIILIPVILLCGGCSVLRYNAFNGAVYYDSSDIEPTDESYLNKQHVFLNDKYYTDEIYPNEKQREKAYNLQTYLIDTFVSKDGLFYKSENISSFYITNVATVYNNSGDHHFDIVIASDEKLKVCRDNVFNSLSISIRYDLNDIRLMEKVDLFREYIDKSFYSGFSEWTNREYYPLETNSYSSASFEIYEHNTQINYSISYDRHEQKITESFSFNYHQTLDYIKGYEEITDKLSKDNFLFMTMYIDNKIKKLSFQNMDMTPYYTKEEEEEIFPMKIDLLIQEDGVKKIRLIKHIGKMPPENANAIACALEAIGSSKQEIESIINEINEGTTSDLVISKVGNTSFNVRLQNRQYIILEFWQ